MNTLYITNVDMTIITIDLTYDNDERLLDFYPKKKKKNNFKK